MTIIITLITLSLLPILYAVLGDMGNESTLKVVGSLTGLIGAVLMVWQVILGLRGITKIFGRDYVGYLKLHIWLGTFGMLIVLLHPFLEAARYGITALFPSFSSNFSTYVTVGDLAMGLLAITWILSVLMRNKLSYRMWLMTHYTTYFILPLTFIHGSQIGSYLSQFGFLADYWDILSALFYILVIWRIATLFGWGSTRYKITNIIKNDDGVTSYTLMPTGKKLVPDVGQFFFLKTGILSEAHPFTVMEFDEGSGKLVFSIKNVGMFTADLERLQEGAIVQVDGPYGIFTKEGREGPMVIFYWGYWRHTIYRTREALFGTTNLHVL